MKVHSTSWKQAGVFSLWWYAERDKNYPGWHCTADEVGVASVTTLLDALSHDGPTTFRTLHISPPPMLALPNKYKRGGWVSPAKLRLVAGQASDWQLVAGDKSAELIVGSEWLPQVRAGLIGILRGEVDYSIGPRARGSIRLWFW